MEHLPFYIEIVFAATVLLTLLLLYKAGNYTKPLIIITIAWLALQAALGLSGFYKVTGGQPPRFALLLIPPIIGIIFLFLTRKGKLFLDRVDINTLTILHIVRVPVEITLYWLFLYKAVPEVMTFAGRNFDILCGITAPFIYYFGFVRKKLTRNTLITWNILSLLLLANIVITAVLSAPFAFQKFGFDQPNIALFYFPFVWLPGFVVPAALFAHLATIRRLLTTALRS